MSLPKLKQASDGVCNLALRYIQTGTKNELANLPVAYNSLEDIMNVINGEEYRDTPEVKNLLEVYSKYKTDGTDIQTEKAFKYPFIVLEGLDGTGKSTVSRLLAQKLNAEALCTPPMCLHDIRASFDNSPIRTAFYSLGNYIAANQIAKILTQRPVVLDRFWHSTTAYAVAQAVQNSLLKELPSKDDSIFKWPHDLLKPDKVFLLTVSEETRLYRLRNRNSLTPQELLLKESEIFRNNVLGVYSNMEDPVVHTVAADGTAKEVVNILYNNVGSLNTLKDVQSV